MTDYQKQLSRKYIAYKVFASMFFMEAVWLYFYRLFINDQQVGLLDGVAFAIGLISEVPSGSLADKFGRDRLVKLGQILAGTGLLIQAFGSSFAPFFVGQSIMMIGVSFTSGADESLFFDNLKFDKNSSTWRKLVTRGTQFTLIASLFAVIFGGWLHTINPRIPWILSGLTFLVSALLIWDIKDPQERLARQQFRTELGEYLNNIKTGFLYFRTPQLWLYVPLIITVQGLFYASGWGLLRLVLLDRFTFDPFWGSAVLASSSLITVGLLAYMHQNAERLSEKKVLIIIALSAVASLLLSVANIGLWGYIVILMLYAGEFSLHPFMSEILNKHAPEKQRATILSVGSFLRTLPYVALAPIIGYLNTNGKLEYFLVIWSLFILIAILIYISNKKHDEYIEIAE